MCGLAAAVWRDEPCPEAVARVSSAMVRRGPDGAGDWQAPRASLAHRRLAIIDVDARADQPMASASGRHVIVFNGEIYNYEILRDELLAAGVALRTHSDTEVLVELFERSGPAMLTRLRGMFAFAVWDTWSERLFVARDAYGIKPLYLASTPRGVLVGSSVRALLASGLVSRDPDPQGIAGYWLCGSVPEPRTWFRDITALPAGHSAWISPGSGMPATTSWCEIGAEFLRALDERGAVDLQAEVQAAMSESVDHHRVADVPVAVFLSAGIDSGALAALLAQRSTEAVAGVTLSFGEYDGAQEDETGVAADVARRYGLASHTRVVTRREFDDDLPDFLSAMDLPTVDGVNTWFVSKATRELGFKVAISGVGGDELFQGYHHYRRIPTALRWGSALRHVPGGLAAAAAVGSGLAQRRSDGRWRELPGALVGVTALLSLTRGLFSVGDLPELMGPDLVAELPGGSAADTWLPLATGGLAADDLPAVPRVALSSLESRLYLRNQLLRDSDWASMAHSLELRTPLVDRFLLHRLAPHLGAFRRHPHKSLLADSPTPPLPVSVTGRGKTGFNVPTSRWMAEITGGRVASTRDWCRFVGRRYAETA